MKQQLDKESRIALVSYRLKRAKDTLAEAEQIIELNFLNSLMSESRAIMTILFRMIWIP